MGYRTFGCSPLKVSPICLGSNVFGWTADKATSFSILDTWLDAGFNERGLRTSPIASVSSLAQLAELEATLRLKLSADDIALLDQASVE